MTPPTLSTAEAATYINGRQADPATRRRISPAKLRKWAAVGYCPAARNGTEWIFTPASLDLWLESGLADWSQRHGQRGAA